MADVNVKMGVSGVSQFKQGMSDASASVKTFDAALKANEKQLKVTGDAENYMQAQTTLLNGKLEAQKKIVKNAEQALKQMEANGVKTTSKAYQDMQRRLIEAQSGIMDTEQALNDLGTSATEAAGKTDKLETSLGGIGKKMSLDQVISGIDSITGAMEKAAKKAVDLGKQIWENITDAARWSDDVNTQAAMLGMDVEDYQAYKDVFDTFADLSVQEWMKAKTKVQKAMLDPTGDQLNVLQALGLAPQYGGKGSLTVSEVAGDWEDMLWNIGQKLREKVASGELTQDMADLYANQIFGKSFASLNPLLGMGREAFEAKVALEKETAASKEAVEANAELNDKMIKLKGDIEQVKAELTSGLAPALSKAADAISTLLGNIMEYLKSPDGQKALADMSTAVSGLFDDLTNIDPKTVVEGFTGVFNTVVDSVKWLVENKEGVVSALEWILGGWAMLKVTGGVLDIVKLVSGIKGLTGSAAASAGAEAGTAWGGAFASAVMKAAPWLVGMYTLLNPASSASDDVDTLVDKNGNLTTAGKDAGLTEAEAKEAAQSEQNYRDARKMVMDATGLTEKQIKTLQGFWTTYKDVAEKGNNAGGDLLKRYNEYGQKLPEVFKGQEDQLRAYTQKMKEMFESGNKDNTLDWTFFNIDKNGVEVPVDPKIPDNAAEQISEEIGTANINCVVHFVDANGNNLGVTSDFWGTGTPTGKKRTRTPTLPGHANGLWSVPFDGYTAILHKDEQIVPARAVNSSRNFSSNLYVESMYMNNGQTAEGLAAAIAAANRRTMRGYGS